MKNTKVKENRSEFESNLAEYQTGDQNIENPGVKDSISNLKKKKKIYTWMIYLVAFVSGTRVMTQNVNLWYLKNKLNQGINSYLFFLYYSNVMSNLKPILSFITEIFFLFYSRIKFYTILSSLMICISSFLICIIEVDYWQFFYLSFIQCTGYALVESVVEGLTAEVVKIDTKIVLLKSTLDPDNDKNINSKKSFGNFYNYRVFTINASIFFGSYFVEIFQSLVPFFAVQGIISSSLIFFTVFVYEEEKKKKIFSSVSEIVRDLILVFKYVFEPSTSFHTCTSG